jgi:anti-sigma factor RsiW
MNVHQEWTDQLSEYLDGELSADQRQAVETHLRGCADCTAVLNDLKRVIARAAVAEARPPQADLWPGIAARIDAGEPGARVMPFARRESRRVAFTLPQLAAAAALLIAVSGGIAWEAAERIGASKPADAIATASPAQPRRSPADDPASGGGAGNGAADFARVETVSMADAQYDAAVQDLEKALKAGRGHLDASTIVVVEHNLQIIDQAINQAREALAADPANSYLSSHLVEARRRKLDLLRRATALASETN